MAADLDTSAVRLTDLREDGKAELIEIIEAVSCCHISGVFGCGCQVLWVVRVEIAFVV